jgi:lipoprotein-releasing system permease protein
LALRFEALLAWRYVTSSRGQTGLTVAAVAAAVCLITFINCLLLGVQTRFINDLIGSMAHVSVKVPDPDPKPLPDTKDTRYAVTVQKQLQQRTDLRRPGMLEALLHQYPNVQHTAASVGGQAFLIRGVRQFGVTVRGAEPAKQENISRLSEDMVQGRWLSIGPNDIVIGFKLAQDTGVSLADTVTVVSSEGIQQTYIVAGIFDTGQVQVDGSTVFVTLRAAQQLFATGNDAKSISIKLDDPWQAGKVSRLISDSLGLKTENWMEEQAQLVNAFAAQNGSRLMISFFSLAASAFGIASVLIVSVIQRSRQIGILKSMGAKDSQILRVFALQGLFISVIGAVAGALSAYALLTFLSGFKQVARFGKSDQLFPAILDPKVFAMAMLSAIVATMLAALLPALRAARTNPVEVINEG